MKTSLNNIKICGLKDPLLASEAVKLGAQFIGIVMDNNSKRYVEIELAKEIATKVKLANGIPVGVFNNIPIDEIKTISEVCGFKAVQLHGHVSQQNHYKLPESLIRILAISVEKNGAINVPNDDSICYLNIERDYLLFDNTIPGQGETFNHNNFHYKGNLPYFIAGGLNPENIKNTISLIKPNGVDVSTGVENSTGIKDKNLIKQFITNAKRAFNHD